MKQIYNFECVVPPYTSEELLRAEIERRRTKQMIGILSIGSLLILLSVMMVAEWSYGVIMILSNVCMAYIFIALLDGVVILVMSILKRRSFKKC